MITAEQIREQIAAYVLGQSSLDDYEDWFVSNSWNVQQSSDLELQKLVFEIEAKLAEYSGGYIEEDSLRSKLANYANRYVVNLTVGGSPGLSVQTSSSQSITPVPALQIRSVDIQPEVVSV